MPRSRYRIFETEYPYFMTCTIVGWLPVFTRPQAAEIIFDSWRYLQRAGELKLFGYVILENHLHLIASASELSAVMRRFKSHTARQVIDLLENHSVGTLLRQLQAHKLNYKTESKYQVWQEGNHAEQIQTESMMRQKLEYVHNNPVERGYVENPVHWRYSSARNYAGQTGLIEVITGWR